MESSHSFSSSSSDQFKLRSTSMACSLPSAVASAPSTDSSAPSTTDSSPATPPQTSASAPSSLSHPSPLSPAHLQTPAAKTGPMAMMASSGQQCPDAPMKSRRARTEDSLSELGLCQQRLSFENIAVNIQDCNSKTPQGSLNDQAESSASSGAVCPGAPLKRGRAQAAGQELCNSRKKLRFGARQLQADVAALVTPAKGADCCELAVACPDAPRKSLGSSVERERSSCKRDLGLVFSQPACEAAH